MNNTQMQVIVGGGYEALVLVKELLLNAKKSEKDGNNKVLTATQLVKEIAIDGLSTTALNKWFVSRKLGYYKRFNNEKKRTFQPNDNFRKYIAKEGYSLTGATVDGAKIKVLYSKEMLERINRLYRKDIIKFIEEII